MDSRRGSVGSVARLDGPRYTSTSGSLERLSWGSTFQRWVSPSGTSQLNTASLPLESAPRSPSSSLLHGQGAGYTLHLNGRVGCLPPSSDPSRSCDEGGATLLFSALFCTPVPRHRVLPGMPHRCKTTPLESVHPRLLCVRGEMFLRLRKARDLIRVC